MKVDTVVRGGTVVTVGGRAVVDIGITDGRIVQLGGELTADRELDATGHYITPGGIDAHTHLTDPTRQAEGYHWADDFESGSHAAVAGGITTIGNMSFPEYTEAMPLGIDRDLAEANELSVTDFFLHPVMINPMEENLASIEQLHKDGFTSLKIFMSFGSFDRHVNEFVKAMLTVKKCGGITLIHCEDAAIMECCCNMLRELGKTDPRYFPEARPVVSEVVSTQRAVGFVEATGCPAYVVHLASARALAACHDGRSRGLPVYVETRPIYLHLTKERFEEEDGAKYAGAPPLRDQSDVDALWAGLAFGNIDTLATDHAPWKLEEKLDPAFDATNLRQGVADLETCMPMLYSAGVLTGRITREQFVAVTSTNPAKLFGLYPRKGTIAVGSDADLVIWDDNKNITIDGKGMYSRSDYSPYDGFSVTGWPKWTINRGEVVFSEGEIVGTKGRGELIRRGPHRAI